MGKAWFKDWFNSSYYHKLYFERDEKEAAAFIHELIKHLQPANGSRMLDVACGKGRHSITLASEGYDVTGIDISTDSIAIARKSEKEHLSFFVHDMRLPFYSNYFQYAFNFFTSFGYFRTRREHNAAIRTIASSLKKEGTFVIDYLNVHYAEQQLVEHESREIEGTLYDIHRWSDDNHFFKKITVKDQELKDPIEFTEKVAKFTLTDFKDMLSHQGLHIQEVFGDYLFNSYAVETSPRLIIIAKK